METTKPISYDYKTTKVKREMEEMFTDAYRNLGWQVTSQVMAPGTLNTINISLKRDRHIHHKAELDDLQLTINHTLNAIEKIQDMKKHAGRGAGITVGTIGVLTFGGGMSMAMTLNGLGFMLGGIALGVVGIGIGFLGWLTAHLVKKHKLKTIEPELENTFAQFSQLCEDANQILSSGGKK